jgi:NinB protein
MARAVLIIRGNTQRQRAIEWCRKVPEGTRIEFKEEKRSTEQNDLMWAALTDVAAQATHAGKKWTTDEWKAIFMSACGNEVRFIPALDGHSFIPWGHRSSDLSKHEMSELIDFIHAWGAQNGVTFSVREESANAG